MRRRNFISLVGGAVAWPVAARGQQRERMRRIGVLSSVPSDDPEVQARMAAFHQGLQENGWVIGRNLWIEYRWSRAGDPEQLRTYAAELIALTPEVILAVATSAVGALQPATRSIPIVFVQVSDPVGTGFVESIRGRTTAARRSGRPSRCSTNASGASSSATRACACARSRYAPSKRYRMPSSATLVSQS